MGVGGRCAYRTSVLTFAVLISYMRRTASVIWRLLARVSTMKTSVLLSSIFFMADSVVSGYLITRNLSINWSFATDVRGYLQTLRFCNMVVGKDFALTEYGQSKV